MQTLVGLRFRRTLERLGEPLPAYLRQREAASRARRSPDATITSPTPRRAPAHR